MPLSNYAAAHLWRLQCRRVVDLFFTDSDLCISATLGQIAIYGPKGGILQRQYDHVVVQYVPRPTVKKKRTGIIRTFSPSFDNLLVLVYFF